MDKHLTPFYKLQTNSDILIYAQNSNIKHPNIIKESDLYGQGIFQYANIQVLSLEDMVVDVVLIPSITVNIIAINTDWQRKCAVFAPMNNFVMCEFLKC